MNTQNPEPQPSVLEELSSQAVSRRRFLIGTGMVAGAAVITAACGDDNEPSPAAPQGGATDSRQPASGDADIAKFAAGLEVLAVDTYKAAADAATTGKLGPVPPAGAEFVKTALAHHQEHLAAWNKVLESAGQPEVTAPNAQLKPMVDAELAKVKDFGGAAKLALTLEETAAATYLNAVPTLKSKDAIRQAASIQAIDAKHVAVLLFVLGQYPVPDTFAKTDKAAKP